LYCTRNKRRASPKYLAGESYGTTRAAGLSGYLQNRHGMYLNGIVLVSSVVALTITVPALLIVPGRFGQQAIFLGFVGGLAGVAGFVLYLRCMAGGPMGLVSPLSALVGAAVPVAWGVVLAGERLQVSEALGIVAGLIAVVAVAYTPGASLLTNGTRGPLLALASGVGFGLSSSPSTPPRPTQGYGR